MPVPIRDLRQPVLAAALVTTAVFAACAKPEQSPPSPPAAAVGAVPNPAATPTPAAAPAATPTPEDVRPASAAEPPGTLSASRAAELACVDKWLAGRKLDPYGNPLGTMYAGGTPLFDERTGEHVDRLAYVYKRQPLAREACRPTAVN